MLRLLLLLFVIALLWCAVTLAHHSSIQKGGGRVSTQEAELVQALLEQTRESQRAWVNGESASYASERMSHTDRFTIFGPFGGLSPKGWSNEVARIQAGTAKAFQGGTSAIELVQSYVSSDLAVLVTIERNQVRFAGHEGPLPWNLRTTQVYERDVEGQWKIVHRHADPLLPVRDLEQTLRLLAP
jgi:ketosteroid isomerase-like protein